MLEVTMELCLEQRSNSIIRAKLRTLLKIPMAFLQKQLMAKSPYLRLLPFSSNTQPPCVQTSYLRICPQHKLE